MTISRLTITAHRSLATVRQCIVRLPVNTITGAIPTTLALQLGLTQLTARPPTTHIRATTTCVHRATQPYRHARRPTTTTITWSISVQVNMRTPSTATQPAITTIIHRLTAPSSMTMLNCAQPPERPIINHSLTSVRVSPLQKSTLPTNTVRSITHTTLTRSSIANLRYRHPLLHQPLILI